MNGAEHPVSRDSVKRRNWRRATLDILLLPPALLYIVIEQVFWTGAKSLLRRAGRIKAVEAMRNRLEKLPPLAVLPLFLVPLAFSHAAGFYASDLLVRREWMAAISVAVFIKGTATLLEVWIYQTCEPRLLSIRWFAWTHGQFIYGRDWVSEQIRQVINFALRLIHGSRSAVPKRFTAMIKLLTSRLGLSAK